MKRAAPPKRTRRQRNASMRAMAASVARQDKPHATMSGTTTGPMPKAPKAKPGKGTMTKEEERWIAAILSHGCVACCLDGSSPRPSAVHHILRGGRRMGHLYSLPLCDPGHHQNGQPLELVSRHPHKPRFEKRYGCEQTLLNGLQRKLGFPLLSLEASK